MTPLLSLDLNLNFTEGWETDLKEVIKLSDINATLEQFREDRRHLRDPAYSIILFCYFLVLILAGFVASFSEKFYNEIQLLILYKNTIKNIFKYLVSNTNLINLLFSLHLPL